MNGHTANGVCTSSNGYYGFQPASSQPKTDSNGQADGRSNGHVDQSEDCDMETDTAPVSSACNGSGISNGHGNGLQPSPPNAQPNKISFGFNNGHVNGTILGFSNGHNPGKVSKMFGSHTNGVVNGSQSDGSHNEDITLNPGICQNHIPIAGCKRSREEGMMHEVKRMRTEGKVFFPVAG